MPREDRRIYFDNSEVYKALYALSAKKQMAKMQPGNITQIAEQENDHDRINITIENPLDGSSAKMEFTRDFFAAAMMLYCKGAGIPLPKVGQKSVLITEGQAVLRVQV